MSALTRVLSGALVLTLASSVYLGTAQASAGPAHHTTVQQLLDRLTGEDGAPGALVEVRDRTGVSKLTSGVADLHTGAPMTDDVNFRIGSMTKPFVATVVLQLVGEHRIALDAPLERYLPGLVRGNGNDGRRITVRNLLQHTSGLPDYLTYLTPQEILSDPYAHHDQNELLGIALAHPRLFKPGAKGRWSYSNTNYLLAGMLIEKVTGHSYGTEIRRRIVVPLQLGDTEVPGDAVAIPEPHPRGYARPAPGAEPIDVTEFNPSVAAGSGDMISSASDMSRFLDALLHGRLLRPAQLAEMTHTKSTGLEDHSAYGLGLFTWSLPCGGVYWGHPGDILGFQTMTGATTDGRQATVMVNLDPGGTEEQDADLRAAVATALCVS
ncbi:D-alanyl-D-alanine carboxypeptidase [Asanoa ferruginea]|uniref:D-alanyl-D-alanine carboxypeptidase n=1 Tax=Asanoa ferruginea TaxID=53367 RepID=A0A3D9ZU90_9ACTN|nr:serine hydrolase domain-containing protein [Asanoa ferruginea]REG00752.1 D-alanyl-D-alanine carboxypeptidase [Asanoa ferruginea]GIF47373.1 serine hydrolase [Asanoa ferruginea]